MKQKPISIERFIYSYALLLGHLPQKIDLAGYETKVVKNRMTAQSMESFGFFGNDTPGLTNYYPSVTEEDLKPKDGEFIEPLYRALSMVLVRPYFPVDFSKPGVLKASTKKLIGQTVYVNHDAIVGNELGAVSEAVWQEAYTASDGTKVPAGINARLKIDGKSNPKIARGMMMDPPSIHSVSVTVEFTWEKSHPNLTDDEFYNKLGTYDKNGELIRRVVDEVRNYHEISLVAHGADVYAQKIDESGNSKEIVNPKYAKTTYRFSNGTEKEFPLVGVYNYRESNSTLERFSDPTIPNPTKNKETPPSAKSMNAQLLALLTLAGISLTGIETDAQAQAALNTHLQKLSNDLAAANGNLATRTTELTAAQGQVTKLTNDLATANTTISTLTKDADFGKAALKELREEGIRLHGVLTNGKPKENTVKLLNESSADVVKVLVDGYRSEMESRFPNNSRQSSEKTKTADSTEQNSKEEKPADENKGKQTYQKLEKPRDNADVMAELAAHSGAATRLHG